MSDVGSSTSYRSESPAATEAPAFIAGSASGEMSIARTSRNTVFVTNPAKTTTPEHGGVGEEALERSDALQAREHDLERAARTDLDRRVRRLGRGRSQGQHALRKQGDVEVLDVSLEILDECVERPVRQVRDHDVDLAAPVRRAGLRRQRSERRMALAGIDESLP